MRHVSRRLLPLGLGFSVLFLLLAPAWAAVPGSPNGRATAICKFDKGAFPESLAIHGDSMYVSLGFAGRVVRRNGAGVVDTYAQLDPGRGLITGLAFDTVGNLYVGVATFSTDPLPYIAKITSVGSWTKFAVLPEGTFPNGLAFDSAGSLYVSDSHSTILYKVGANGSPSPWLDSPLLAPNKGLGANGIAFDESGDMWIVVSNTGTILRVPVLSNGSAGTPVVVKQGRKLKTADGIAFGPDGRLYIAVNQTNSLWVLGMDGSFARVANRSDGLSYPTQPAFGSGKLFLTNGALYNGVADLISFPSP
jgi:sugar lactone lactonase YvrE